MRHIIKFVLILISAGTTIAQQATELYLAEGKLYLELSNSEGNTVNEVAINCEFCDTVLYATPESMKRLSVKGAIEVLELMPTVDTGSALCPIWYISVSINKGEVSRILETTKDGYSESFLDYEQFQASRFKYLDIPSKYITNDISKISRPTIGQPNSVDSLMIYVRGKLLDEQGMPFCNQLFWAFNKFVDSTTGDSIIKTNSEGYFDIAILPNNYQYLNVLLFDSTSLASFHAEPIDYWEGQDSYLHRLQAAQTGKFFAVYGPAGIEYPGYEQLNLKRGEVIGINTESLAHLTLSPNPARETVAVGYELPAGSDSRSFRIALISESGRTARTEPLRSVSGTQSVSLGGIPHGQYSCIIRTAGGEVIGKENLIVE